jgi:hypothetical protein
LFRDPRGLIEERFARSRMDLRTIRALLFHRVQCMLGFAFLLTGFAMQLFGRFRPLPVEEERGSSTLWIGLVVLLAVGLETAGWWWSQRAFRRSPCARSCARIRSTSRPTLALAREWWRRCSAFESHADDTVQSYVTRLRRSLGMVLPAVRARRARAARSRTPTTRNDGGLARVYARVTIAAVPRVVLA